jgi:glucan phosphoethanolaminetransferase (alkaline phosphatase superfamily)
MFTKKYLQDRPILFLNILLIAIMLLTVTFSFLTIDSSKQLAIVSYNLSEGLDGYVKTDKIYELYYFGLSSVLFTAVAVFLSTKLYKQKRMMSLLLLSLTSIVLMFNFIVSVAILNLQ